MTYFLNDSGENHQNMNIYMGGVYKGLAYPILLIYYDLISISHIFGGFISHITLLHCNIPYPTLLMFNSLGNVFV